ncbi:MAG: DNA double-strand break repair nuclease NurA [Armatimonadota bacterium]|nr:DNA double-strand break repair nuclease NurA [Armatimonadota bacterium]
MDRMSREESLFGDLPDALVKELLDATLPVAQSVREHIHRLQQERESLRQQAKQLGLIQRKADLDVLSEPSVVGVDGSYQIHRLTAFDLCAAAAVAVEGTVKEAKRHWPEPHHSFWIGIVPHRGQPSSVLRGLMVSLEIELASKAPHELVLLDGSFASLIIYINQGVSQLEEVAHPLSSALRERWASGDVFRSLLSLLRDKRVAAIPKFTSHNELSAAGIQVAEEVDGKTLATIVLEPGEYTKPLPLGRPPSPYHLPEPADNRKLNEAMQELRVIYFRPYGWTAAVRIEVPSTTARSNTFLSKVLEGIQRQFLSPAVREPYPLFLADRIVKSLGAGINVAEQVVAQQIAEESVDVETTLLFLQNYRTESGRGDTA